MSLFLHTAVISQDNLGAVNKATMGVVVSWIRRWWDAKLKGCR